MLNHVLEKESSISFEVTPPMRDDQLLAAYEKLDQFGALQPDFISVAYGPGGGLAKKTVEIASYIQNSLHIDSIAHMTGVGETKESILDVCAKLKEANVQNILALRGDRPDYMSDEQYNGREFFHATDLIDFLKKNEQTRQFHLSAACYPEKHFESPDMDTDLNYLKEKQDKGAQFFVTQFFFDNDIYYNFIEQARKKGISVPIFAGIMPATSKKQLEANVSLADTSIPKQLSHLLEKYGNNDEEMRKAGVDYAIRQILALQEQKLGHIHIFTMNRAKLAKEMMEAIR